MSLGKILIVDDMPDIRMLATRILQKAGFQVREAETGRQAIESIQSDPELDIVLLDIMLPDMGGYEVMNRIKKLKEEFDFKVCFLSGKKDKAAVLKAVESGGDDYIVKPIYAENLISKIGILLKNADLIEDYHLMRCNLKAELLTPSIRPDIQIRGVDELSLLIYCTAYVEPETQLEVRSQKLGDLIKHPEAFSLKVNKCRREAFGKYFIRCRFVGLTEQTAKKIRQLVIKGQFVS